MQAVPGGRAERGAHLSRDHQTTLLAEEQGGIAGSVRGVPPTPLTTAAEVLVATGHDPFARLSLRRPVLRGWAGGGATVWVGTDAQAHLPYLSGLGVPAAVGGLLGEVVAELPHGHRVTLPRGTRAHLPAWVSLDGTDWDLRWLPSPPARQPGEDRVVQVDDPEQVRELLARASPTASAQPGDPQARRWAGISSPAGELLACAADTSATPGVGHLSSIAVDPSARGHGLGRAVTAALARRLFDEGADLVTLGMYAGNAAGRAVYDALGFRDEHRFTSGQLSAGSTSTPASLRCAAVITVGAPVSGSPPPPVLGKAMTSRIESAPVTIAAMRSIPKAMPPCGGGP